MKPTDGTNGNGGSTGHPEVETSYGRIRGVLRDEVHHFLGVPYAMPPLGPLRFLPPVPPLPWTKTLNCTDFGDSAVQAHRPEPQIAMSEDCLYLNIWAPANAAGKSLPVLVFIHGGGFAGGSPAQLLLHGTRFAKDGVIQVNITYRLGALGFMAFPEVEAQYGNLGNTGLLDQIAALKWVQENIAQFGGDADNVTVCGESAGAFSVSCLMLSPLAKGLFRRAILESGNLLGQRIVAPRANGCREQAISASARYMRSFGAANLTALRRVGPKRLSAGCDFRDDMTSPPVYNFWPVFDGYVIPKDPHAALMAGRLNCTEMLCGYNTDEGTLFIPNGTDEEGYVQLAQNIFGENYWKLLERYPANRKSAATQRARTLVKLGLFMGSNIFADKLAADGRRVYCYRFDYRNPALEAVGLGVMHALELPFVFDTIPGPIRMGKKLLGCLAFTHSAWLNFIISGNPNSGVPLAVPWPAYSYKKKETMVIDGEPTTESEAHTEDIAFLRGLLW